MYVFDSSVMLASFFPDETTPRSVSLMRLMASGTVHVPSIWPLEITNVLVTSERRGRITPAHSASVLDLVSQMRVIIHAPPEPLELPRLAWLARLFDLSIYDAEYLDLAYRKTLPLASFDEKLIRAAEALGVVLL